MKPYEHRHSEEQNEETVSGSLSETRRHMNMNNEHEYEQQYETDSQLSVNWLESAMYNKAIIIQRFVDALCVAVI